MPLTYPLPNTEIYLSYEYHSKPNQDYTLVFLHDSLGCIALWRNFPEQLSKANGMNSLVYDRAGYGTAAAMPNLSKRSTDYHEIEADILVEFLHHLAIKNPILFGHSDGATIALIAAGKYPNFIKGCIVEGAHSFVEEITLNGIIDAKKEYQKNNNLHQKLTKYHGEKVAQLFMAWTETWLAPDFKTWNIYPFLEQISCPVFVIQGEEDEFGSFAQIQVIIEKVKGAKHQLLVKQKGHSPHKELPDVVLKETSLFLKRYFIS